MCAVVFGGQGVNGLVDAVLPGAAGEVGVVVDAVDDSHRGREGVAAPGMGDADGAEFRRGEDADGVDRTAVQAACDDSDLGKAGIEILEAVRDVGGFRAVESGWHPGNK